MRMHEENSQNLKALTMMISAHGIRLDAWLKTHPDDEFQVLIDHLPYGHMHSSSEEMGLYLKKYFDTGSAGPQVGIIPDASKFSTFDTMLDYLATLATDIDTERIYIQERIAKIKTGELWGIKAAIDVTKQYRSMYFCFLAHVLSISVAVTLYFTEEKLANARRVREAVDIVFSQMYDYMYLGADPHL